MIPLTNSVRLLLPRFLLSLVVRFRLSLGGIALVFRNWFTSLCKSILSLARRRGQLGIRRLRYNASIVPTVTDSTDSPMGEPPQTLERNELEEEVARGTLATLPVLGALCHGELSRFQALTSSHLQFKKVPAIPEGGSQRYKPKKVKQNTDPLDIPAGQQILLSQLPQPPQEWRRQVHPEGNVSFYHEKLRIFTENDISDHTKEKQVLSCAATLIQEAIQTDNVILDDLTELVLNVDGSQCWHYYFVDHTRRLLFWVVPVSGRDLGTDLQWIDEYSHIKYFLEKQYWHAFFDLLGMSSSFYIRVTSNIQLRSHCEYYPHNRTLPKRTFADLRGMLNYFKTDMMTTDSSPSPFAQDELVAISDLINSLKDDDEISGSCSIWVIARLMGFFTENQFYNFHGQSCARLNADIPMFEEQTWHHHLAFKIINVFLFGSPMEHSVRLQRIWVDGIIIQPRWKGFTDRLTTELGRYTVFSTVMLAVNFSFLAVPGVTASGSTAGAIDTIIYGSVVSTTASIIFSFVLLNVYSNPGLMVAGIAAEAMRTLGQSNTGMACLSITHSLPIACLVWSIMFFSVALAIQIFRTGTSAIVSTLSIECFILLLFAGMSVRVLRRFSRRDVYDDETNDLAVDASAESDSSPRDVELGTIRENDVTS